MPVAKRPSSARQAAFYLFVLVLFAGACELASADKGGTLVLRGATIYTVSGGIVQDGTMVVAGGKIVAVGGSEVKAPPGARVVDLTGKTIVPGLIDTRSQLFLGAESLQAGKANWKATDAVDHFDPALRKVVAGGVTSVLVAPRGTMIGGLAGVVKLLPAGETKRVVSDRSFLTALFARALGKSVSPVARIAMRKAYVSAFEAALKYREMWKKYEEAKKKYEAWLKKNPKAAAAPGKPADKKGKPADKKKDEKKKNAGPGEPGFFDLLTRTAVKQPAPAPAKTAPKKVEKPPVKPKEPVKNEHLEVLLEVVDGKLPLVVEAHRKADMLEFLKLHTDKTLQKKFKKVRVLFSGATEAWRITKELKKSKVGLLFEPPLPRSTEGLDYVHHRPDNSALCVQEGLTVAIGSQGRPPGLGSAYRYVPMRYGQFVIYRRIPIGSGSGAAALESRFLLLTSARSVAFGLGRGNALKAVTLSAAQLLGVDKRIGSLEKGKDADFVVLDGDPTDALSEVLAVYIDGRLVHQKKGRK